MTLWLVALPGFVIISSVSGIVNVMCLVIPAAACLLTFGSLGAFISPSGFSEVQITKCEITISGCIMEVTDTRAFGIRG